MTEITKARGRLRRKGTYEVLAGVERAREDPPPVRQQHRLPPVLLPAHVLDTRPDAVALRGDIHRPSVRTVTAEHVHALQRHAGGIVPVRRRYGPVPATVF